MPNHAVQGTRCVGLVSRSNELLLGVQELLASLGIASQISHRDPDNSYDLRINRRSLRDFASTVGFTVRHKQELLQQSVEGSYFYVIDETVALVSRVSTGFETTYNLTEPRNHSSVSYTHLTLPTILLV